ncbi:maleylpyruvate isomerase N-terminal domain-containing protein [Streptomyces prunicolor]|uniref:maleylpyruvate isomerase N-terminal domain-containing protein n=1 Tax=Streptomyces prunicolor TaxID=67348 RepID=UPI002256D4B6|nr:maleylpyruvate isomerase N-terminal domain-containing protein [Streptomyces prunicolor]MCX5238931.1 maleylpyruvate isomerase N-terminal domain-containing protein [Streptomyces prunicolor]
MKGFRLATQDLLLLADTLDDADWNRPSGAGNWSVKDVFSHTGQLISLLVSAVQGTLQYPDPPLGIEPLNEVLVGATRGQAPAAIVDFLRVQSELAFPVFDSLQDEPLASSTAELLDLGIYELHAIANMFSFDFATHLRFDLLGPRGPLDAEVPPMDDDRMEPSVYWLLGGIPKMQRDLHRSLLAPLALDLTGPASTRVVLHRVGDTILVEDPATAPAPAAQVTSSTFEFLAWSTTRIPWREATEVTGDTSIAATFLDELNLI